MYMYTVQLTSFFISSNSLNINILSLGSVEHERVAINFFLTIKTNENIHHIEYNTQHISESNVDLQKGLRLWVPPNHFTIQDTRLYFAVCVCTCTYTHKRAAKSMYPQTC